jgi:molecular chaperone GrpE (heat shock protein)
LKNTFEHHRHSSPKSIKIDVVDGSSNPSDGLKNGAVDEAIHPSQEMKTDAVDPSIIESPGPDVPSGPAGREAEYLDQLQRLKAEFDNYRKRTERDREDMQSLLKARVILNLLPVLDDLERMVQFSRGDDGHLASGIGLIHQKMKTILTGEGLEAILPVGKPFDPSMHEAIGEIDAGPEKDGLVAEELERGYTLKGRLLRASRVRVGRHAETGSDDPEISSALRADRE